MEWSQGLQLSVQVWVVVWDRKMQMVGALELGRELDARLALGSAFFRRAIR